MLFQVFFSLALAGPLCAPNPSSMDKVVADLNKAVFNPFQKFCQDVQAVIRKEEPVNKPLCSVFWEGQPNAWTPPPRKYPMIKDSGLTGGLGMVPGYISNPAEGPVYGSREYMQANGYTYVDNAAANKVIQDFHVTKDRLSYSCCGQDQECLAAFRNTPVYFCGGSEADNNPKVFDYCAGSGALTAYFNAEPEALLHSEWHSKRYDKLDPVERQRTLDQIRNKFPSFKPESIGTGYIALPRYFLKGLKGRNDYIQRHELGHACVFVRQQIANKKGTQNFAMDAFSKFGSGSKEFCSFQEGKFENLNLFDGLIPGKDVSAVKDCMAKSIKAEIQDPKNIGYIADACFGAKYEEAMGDVFSALTATDDEHHKVMMSLCLNSPSQVHFTGASTFECLIKNAPGYAEKLYRGASCSRHSYLPRN